jgi:hypothetical protein
MCCACDAIWVGQQARDADSATQQQGPHPLMGYTEALCLRRQLYCALRCAWNVHAEQARRLMLWEPARILSPLWKGAVPASDVSSTAFSGIDGSWTLSISGLKAPAVLTL